MDVRFPYEYEGKTDFGRIWRPVAKVTVKSPVSESLVDIWMVVDTGADYTILPRHFSERLQISLERDCINVENQKKNFIFLWLYLFLNLGGKVIETSLPKRRFFIAVNKI